MFTDYKKIGYGLAGVVFTLALMLLFSAVSGCQTVNSGLVTVEDAVHTGLHNADAELRKICTANVSFEPACADIRPPLLEAVNAGIAFNRGVRDQKISALVPLVTAIGKTLDALKKLPEGQTVNIVKDLLKALAAANNQVPEISQKVGG